MTERTWPCSTPGCERNATMLLTLERLTRVVDAPRLVCLCDHCAGSTSEPRRLAVVHGLL
jgi:hypothetical protein